jgi:hypothetical protein
VCRIENWDLAFCLFILMLAAAEVAASELTNVGFGLWAVSYWVGRLNLQ